LRNRGGTGGRNPAWGLTGGGEEVGEKQEESELYLGMASVGAGMAGAGGATERGGRRWTGLAAAAFRRAWASASGSGSTNGGWGC